MQCIAAGITAPCVALLKDADAVVRERAAGTLRYVATKQVGCMDMIQHGALPPLLELLAVAEGPDVRDAAYGCLVEASRCDCTRGALVRMGDALPRLLQLVLTEDEGRAMQGLRVLLACAQMRHNAPALQQLTSQGHGLPLLRQMLEPSRPREVRELAAQLLAQLASTQHEAKVEAVSVGCIGPLLELLRSGELPSMNAAATALVMLTLCNEGKYAVLEAPGGIAAIAGLIDLQDEMLCQSVLQAITNLAEAPQCRAALRETGVIVRLEAIQRNAPSDLVSRNASQAMRQCTFSHRPFQPLPGLMYAPR